MVLRLDRWFFGCYYAGMFKEFGSWNRFEGEGNFSPEFLKPKEYIGFDIDGVLASSQESGVNEFNKLLGTNYRSKDIAIYDQLKLWAKENGKTDLEAHEINRTVWDNPKVLENCIPMDGAIDLMRLLYDHGHRPPIITSRIGPLNEVTLTWLKNQMPFLDSWTIFTGTHKDIQDGLDFKIASIKVNDLTWFVEDHPPTAETILKETRTNVIMVEHNFNQGYQFEPQYEDRIYWSQRQKDGTPTLRPIISFLGSRLFGFYQ